ncbi:hypothetical protein SOASR015_27160 [Pectobacterium carotovorum subsp. carotovorum]|nr:hypothetical protein SOASR015_27160 [Pectobacterium carotovorum subsp. carotovorum]GLX57407.1 hypothetical protein Pcaca02_27160 [Pectobacterium carotovorum subsp. carotovorum]
MKIKILLWFSCIFIVFVGVLLYLIPVRPEVIIKNNSKNSLYISSGEGKYGVEPDISEVEKIMRAEPEVVAVGKEFRFKPSFMSLIRKDVAIDIGWRTDGRYEYNSIGGGITFYYLLNGVFVP